MRENMCEAAMKGIHSVVVSDKRVRFKFELTRNITIVRGDSGTGKTTLFDMISAAARLKEKSGVRIVCDKPCVTLRPDSDWLHLLENISDSIVFIDEESDYVGKAEFASAIKRTDNYYVIFTRENLHNLPYSVNEIYTIHTSGKLHTFRRLYREQKNYRYSGSAKRKKDDFSSFLTEDSRSGYEFYQNFFSGSKVECFSAGANSSIYPWLVQNKDKKVFVVADGAAFGAEMNRVMKLNEQYPDIIICLPESFEWLILKSGLIKINDIENVLDHPSEYIEASEYFSWEQFFTDFLVQNTRDEHYQYSKNHLNPFYIVKNNANKVVKLIGLQDTNE